MIFDISEKMVLRLVRRLPLNQLFVVTLLGVASGAYIYKPLLENYASKRDSKKKKENVLSVETADLNEVTKKQVKNTSSRGEQKPNMSGVLLIRGKKREDDSSSR